MAHAVKCLPRQQENLNLIPINHRGLGGEVGAVRNPSPGWVWKPVSNKQAPTSLRYIVQKNKMEGQ